MAFHPPNVEKVVYGADLAQREKQHKQLQKKRDELAKKWSVRPWKKRKLLAEIDKKIERDSYQMMGDREIVLANPMSAKFYREEEQRIADQEQKQERQQKLEQKTPVVATKEISGEQHRNKDKAAHAMEWLAKRREAQKKKQSQASEEVRQQEVKKQRDHEWERE